MDYLMAKPPSVLLNKPSRHLKAELDLCKL